MPDFDITRDDVGRYVRRKSTGSVGMVKIDTGNGWLHLTICYEWKAYRDDFEYVRVELDSTRINQTRALRLFKGTTEDNQINPTRSLKLFMGEQEDNHD